MTKPTGKEVSIVALGAPGLGKSTFAGSICEIVPPEEVLLIVAKPGEESSWLYQKYGLDAALYYDANWLPTLDMYEANDYKRLLTDLHALLDDEQYGAVIVDPGTDVINLLEHHILSPNKVGSPGELHDSMGFYRQLKDKAQEFLQSAAILSTLLAKRPKFVIVPWHTQPAKEGAYQKVGADKNAPKVKIDSSDERGGGVEYEGIVLPQLEGGYRRKLAADVSFVVYCDLDERKPANDDEYREWKKQGISTKSEYVIQVRPNKERHAKLRSSPRLMQEYLPNNMKALLDAIEEAKRE